MDIKKPAVKMSETREIAALCASAAIAIIATCDPDDCSEDGIELRCFAESALYRFIAICDEEQ